MSQLTLSFSTWSSKSQSNSLHISSSIRLSTLAMLCTLKWKIKWCRLRWLATSKFSSSNNNNKCAEKWNGLTSSLLSQYLRCRCQETLPSLLRHNKPFQTLNLNLPRWRLKRSASSVGSKTPNSHQPVNISLPKSTTATASLYFRSAKVNPQIKMLVTRNRTCTPIPRLPMRIVRLTSSRISSSRRRLNLRTLTSSRSTYKRIPLRLVI